MKELEKHITDEHIGDYYFVGLYCPRMQYLRL